MYPKKIQMLPFGNGPIRIAKQPQRGTLSKEDRKNKEAFAAFIRQRLTAFPESTVEELWQAKVDAGFETGLFREFEMHLQDIGVKIIEGKLKLV